MSIAAKAALPIAIGNAGAIAASFSINITKKGKNHAENTEQKAFAKRYIFNTFKPT